MSAVIWILMLLSFPALRETACTANVQPTHTPTEQNQDGHEYCIALEHEKSIKASCSLLSLKCDHVSVLIYDPHPVNLGGLSVYQPDVFVTVFPFMSCSDQ